jgi:hypothetical protein
MARAEIVVADISGSICTAEARAARYEGRDVEGKMVLNSPYLIQEMEREARLVQAPATLARAGVRGCALSRIPVPQPRPGQHSVGSAPCLLQPRPLRRPVAKAGRFPLPLRP